MKKSILLLAVVFTLFSFSENKFTGEATNTSNLDYGGRCHFSIVYADGSGGYYTTEYSVYAYNQENCNSIYRQYKYLAQAQ